MKKNTKKVFENIRLYFESLGYKYVKKEQSFDKAVGEALYRIYFLYYSADTSVSIYAEVDMPSLLPYFKHFFGNNCNLCRLDSAFYDADSEFSWNDLKTPEEFEQEINQASEDIKLYYTKIILPDLERVNTVDKFLRVFEENGYQNIKPNNGFLDYQPYHLVRFLILIKLYQPETYLKHKENLSKMLRSHEINYFEESTKKLEKMDLMPPIS